MFDRYMTARSEKPRRWVNLTVSASVIAHVVGGLAIIGISFLKIDRVVSKNARTVEFKNDLTPPGDPQPSAEAPSVAKPASAHKPKSVAVTQPVAKPIVVPVVGPGCVGDDCEVKTKCVGPDCDSRPACVGDDCDKDPPCVGDQCGGGGGSAKPDAGPPPAPVVISQTMIKGHLVAGSEQIHAPAAVLREMDADGKKSVRTVIDLCLDRNGEPSSVEIHKSSGYPALDEAILAGVREWRYQPYLVEGEAVPVCSKVSFTHVVEQ